MAGKLNLKIEQGATFRKQLVWRDASNVLVNLTGASARMQIRPEVSSPTILHAMDSATGGITLGGTAGTVDLYISDTDTSAFAWETGVYDLEVIMANGDVVRLVQGSVVVLAEVTR